MVSSFLDSKRDIIIIHYDKKNELFFRFTRLQVASKYMPKASIKIGVDLDVIKPIKGCVTF